MQPYCCTTSYDHQDRLASHSTHGSLTVMFLWCVGNQAEQGEDRRMVSIVVQSRILRIDLHLIGLAYMHVVSYTWHVQIVYMFVEAMILYGCM